VPSAPAILSTIVLVNRGVSRVVGRRSVIAWRGIPQSIWRVNRARARRVGKTDSSPVHSSSHRARVSDGNSTTDAAFALAQNTLGDWKRPATPLAPQAPFKAPAAHTRVMIVDKPDAGRTAIVAGRVAVRQHAQRNLRPVAVEHEVLSHHVCR